jgi:cell division protein FtsZ
MIEFQREEQVEMIQAKGFLVKVIGVGGAGSNVLDQIALDGMDDAELICLNTDVRTLKTSTAHAKVQIGKQLTRGLGAGGDPELGILAAEEAEEEIRAAVRGQNMVFICTGLGGGTGSGAAPTVSRIAKEEGAFVVVFATMPFSFEGRRRIQQAETSLKLLERSADALITFENDRMGELVLPKEGIQQAFGNADKIISQSVRAITYVVTQPGLIQIGMDDLLTALKNPISRCLFGYGAAKGKNRAQEALKTAMRSPLLDRGKMLGKTRNALVHVVGGPSMSLYEVELLMNEMSKNVGSETQILFGAATDEKMDDQLSVTIISSLTLDDLRRYDTSLADGQTTESSAGYVTTASTLVSEPVTQISTPEEESFEPEEEPSSTVEALLEEAEEEAAAKADQEAAEAQAQREAELAARRAKEEKSKDEKARQEAESKAKEDAEAERSRQEAFQRRRVELKRSYEQTKPTEKPEVPTGATAAANSGANARPSAEDLMAQRRRAQEELERKRAELEKLLKLEDDARRKRPTPNAATSKAAPVAVTNPATSSDFDMSLTDESDLEQTQPRTQALPPSRKTGATAPLLPAKPLTPKPAKETTPYEDLAEQATVKVQTAQTEMQLEPLRGRFEKASPTVMDGENLDVPTFFRKRGKKG